MVHATIRSLSRALCISICTCHEMSPQEGGLIGQKPLGTATWIHSQMKIILQLSKSSPIKLRPLRHWRPWVIKMRKSHRVSMPGTPPARAASVSTGAGFLVQRYHWFGTRAPSISLPQIPPVLAPVWLPAVCSGLPLAAQHRTRFFGRSWPNW